jgi:hypothetical protein
MEKTRENAEVNENLEQFSKSEKKQRKKEKVRKDRFFTFMTYADEKDIHTTIVKHSSSIRAFAYIYHNRDENVPHYHLIVRTYSTWTEAQILKWFDWIKLKRNQNTFVQILDNSIGMNEYLTHGDMPSILAGKEPYSRDEIKDFGLWDIVDKKDSYDETYEIVRSLMAGMSERDLIRRYGKNYLYHRNSYHEAADTIYYEQSKFNRIEMRDDEREKQRMLEIDTNEIDLYDLCKGQ